MTSTPRRRHSRSAPAAALVGLGFAVGVLPAHAVPPPAAAFAQPSDFTFVSLSPDGQKIAMDQPGSNGPRVVVFRPDDGRTLRTINVGANVKLRGLRWADDRTLLGEVSITQRVRGLPKSRNAFEVQRLVAVNLDDGAMRMLLMDDANRQYVTGAVRLPLRPARPGVVFMSSWDYSAAGRKMATGTRLHDERGDSGWTHDLFEVDVATGDGRRIASGTNYTIEWLATPEGRALARAEWLPASDDFKVLAQDGDTWRTLYHRSDGEQLWLVGSTPDGKGVVAIGENGGDRSRAWSLPLDGSPATALPEEATGDVQAAIIDQNSGAVVGLTAGDLATRIHWLDPDWARQHRGLEKAFPGRRVEILERTADGQRALVMVDSPSVPPSHYLVDFDRAKADLVGEGYPALKGAALGEVRAVSFAARDGVQIPALLTLPPGREPQRLPLVVLPHGGPEARDAYAFDWWAQFLATRGYAVLQPQFRGSTGFGRAHRLAGQREWGGRMQDDLTDGVQHFVASGLADAARVCIVGASYGGYAALAGAAFTPELYACAVSVNGVSDLPQMLTYIEKRTGEESNSLDYWRTHIGPPSDPDVPGRSPAKHATRVRAPVLLLHGADDTVVPIAQSEAMARALEAAGKPHRLVRLPGEDHWLSRPATRTRMLEELEAFLAQYLAGPTAPAPQ